MLKEAKEFIHKTLEKDDHYLVGFSGGPDSTALLYLLIEEGISFDVAHIDHGWREESRDEAQKLKEKVESLGIRFHLTRLEQTIGSANLEDRARNERIQFFDMLQARYCYDGLLLGATEDDQVETVLKRVFEGAYLGNIQGMRQESNIGFLRILRPLLTTKKVDILKWLEIRKLDSIVDRTNDDEQFLRPRIRKKILPFLEEAFGKSITKNIVNLGTSCKSVYDYLDKALGDNGVEGGCLEVDPLLSELELEFIIRKAFRGEGLAIRRDEVFRLIKIIKENKGGKKVLFKDVEVKYFRKHLYFLPLANELLTSKAEISTISS